MLNPNSSRSAHVRPGLALLVSALVALGLTACGGGPRDVAGAPAARVGDATLTQDQLEAWIPAFDALAAASGSSETAAGDAPGTWSVASLSALVGAWVQTQIILQAGAERGLEPTDAEIEAARTTALGQVDVDTLPDDFVDYFARATAMQTLLAQDIAADEGLLNVSDEVVEALYEDQKATRAEVCVSQIVVLYADETTVQDPAFVASEEQIVAAGERAADIIGRIEDGADFAVVAAEESDDPATAAEGGDAGCFPVSDIQNQELAARLDTLQPGDLDPEPYPFSTGLLVFQLTDRTVPTLEELREELVSQIQQDAVAKSQELVSKLLVKVAADLNVEVNEKYGTWDRATATLEPPAGPQQPSTTLADLGLTDQGVVPGG